MHPEFHSTNDTRYVFFACDILYNALINLKGRTTMYTDLKDKIALITGAAKKTGIGYAIAEKLASCGMNIVISDIGIAAQDGGNKELEEAAADIAAKFGTKIIARIMDVTDIPAINETVAFIKKEFGGLDVLVNNAGGAFGVPSPIAAYDDGAWLKTFDVNLHSVFRISKACMPLMGGRKGSIINMASRAGKVPAVMNGAYSVTKASVIMLSKVMAAEMAPAGIRVNALCPGLILTDLQRFRMELESKAFGETMEQREKDLRSRVPLGWLGDPAEVAATTAYLASSESSYITGQAINVCGGQTMEL